MMKIAPIVEALIAAGATPEMILAAVRAAENEIIQSDIEREIKEEQRREYERNRKREYRLRALSQGHPGTDRDIQGPSPNGSDGFLEPSLSSLPPIKENPPIGGQKKVSQSGRGTRLHIAWDLPKDWGEWAMQQGMTREAVLKECDKFKDFWISKSGANATKVDWEATWRNWIRKHLEDYSK